MVDLAIIIEMLLIVVLLMAIGVLAKHLLSCPGGKPTTETAATVETLPVVIFNAGSGVYHHKGCHHESGKSKTLTLCSLCAARIKKA